MYTSRQVLRGTLQQDSCTEGAREGLNSTCSSCLCSMLGTSSSANQRPTGSSSMSRREPASCPPAERIALQHAGHLLGRRALLTRHGHIALCQRRQADVVLAAPVLDGVLQVVVGDHALVQQHPSCSRDGVLFDCLWFMFCDLQIYIASLLACEHGHAQQQGFVPQSQAATGSSALCSGYPAG